MPQRTAVIIPARMAATRFPGKVLADLGGKPVIQHVYERCLGAALPSEVLIATDSPEVMDAARGFGARAVMTAASHASGTDRIAEVAAAMDCDIIVNVQGDEPLISPEVIDAVAGLLRDDPVAEMGTAACPIQSTGELLDPNVVKVAVGIRGYALYFSRAPIPYHRDLWAGGIRAEGSAAYRHIGIYSYRRAALLRLAGMSPTGLESTEKLEQLRALEHGITIKVAITGYKSLGVDTPEDLERVRRCLSTSS